MEIIKQSYEILSITEDLLTNIEKVGRTCYKSHDKINGSSAYKFVNSLIKNEHEAVLEFGSMTVKFITDRGISHELVRHRLCSFAQESTRYVRYEGNIQFIKPVWLEDSICGIYSYRKDCPNIASYPSDVFIQACLSSESDYHHLLMLGFAPQYARDVLLSALKTEIVVQANMREWRHIFKLRCSKKAHPQMRDLLFPLLEETNRRIPILFNDIHNMYIMDKE